MQQDKKNTVQHGLNAAQANTENNQEQQQVQELSAKLQNSQANEGAGATAAVESQSNAE